MMMIIIIIIIIMFMMRTKSVWINYTTVGRAINCFEIWKLKKKSLKCD